MDERVMIFIDGSNLYHALKEIIPDRQVNYNKLPRKLCGRRNLVRTYFYTVPVARESNEETYKKQQQFFSQLTRIAYLETRLGRLVNIKGTWVEKGVDVRIAVDMLSMAVKDNYDTAILISRDGDFAYAIEAIKDLGKHVEVAHPFRSHHLISSCDKFVPLTADFLKDCSFIRV